MKKVLIINASIRKKNTYKLLKKIENLLINHKEQENINIEFINIIDYKIQPCIGCQTCIKTSTCPINDDCNKILEKIKLASGIVIGTPVYLRQPPGYFKMLLDRACSWYHRTPIAGKPILTVTTTQASGSRQTNALLKDISNQFGLIPTGSISKTVFNYESEINPKKIKKFLYYLNNQNTKKYTPQLNQIIEFSTQKMLSASAIIEADKKYWIKKQWINKPYYFPCRINPIYRILGYIYFKTGLYFINKNKKQRETL